MSGNLAMLTIKLADGSLRTFEHPVTVLDVARSISSSLGKATLAGSVDGRLVDASYIINADCSLVIITPDHKDALSVIRHSCAHLLAQAVKRCFPSAQVTIGPVIEDGFYYDFAYERPFTPDDLLTIEREMLALAKADYPITRRELGRDEAIAHFEMLGETYKAEIIRDIPPHDVLSLYKQGEFEDLCRGPHVPSTKSLKAFKLTKLAGAYWRGDSRNPMLQRIYGTAWGCEADLKAHIHRLEEAEKRDHRKLGRALDLFSFHEVAPGMVFWSPKGFTIYRLLENYMRERLSTRGYQEVRTPQLVDKILWEKSGHWDNFRENMFITETENRQYAIKPMNCPCHVQLYNQELKSYRDLPLRLSEFGNCHRCEPSGSLHGLMRVRNFVQDDAHIFCTESQIQSEVTELLGLVKTVYDDFGFTHILYRLALRPEKRVGSDEAWDKAEEALKQAMKSRNIAWVDAPGEGAFYGPKIECSLSDSLGRIWQCGTIQVDFSMPSRMDAVYIAEDGRKQTPVILHRAILGTFERFMGILIEHYAGRFPVWLAPVQVVVLTVSDKQHEFASQVTDILQKKGFRVTFDLRNEKIGFKIREHALQKIPYILVIGDKEVASSQISVRSRDEGELGVMDIEPFCDIVCEKIEHKTYMTPKGED